MAKYDHLIQAGEKAVEWHRENGQSQTARMIGSLVNALKDYAQTVQHLYDVCVLSNADVDEQIWASGEAWAAVGKLLGRDFEADINTDDGDDEDGQEPLSPSDPIVYLDK